MAFFLVFSYIPSIAIINNADALSVVVMFSASEAIQFFLTANVIYKPEVSSLRKQD